MTEEDIALALETIDAASKGPKQWGTIAGDTQDEVIPRLVENYISNPEVRAHVVAMPIDGTPIETKCLTVAGWEAALREIRRLRREQSELLRGMKLRHA
jgi:hypothetical protein